ncbi:hypothetical protein CUS_5577 [Ruminococcus albus 8]|uniref:Uncharacterized protein n=1 Tax=Ruminococcus albus 8 TaxID=246199 RepID=E9S8T2_RUMAL|nr:hypothetical protein CUS_5577 [Ruminococcus albus 8]
MFGKVVRLFLLQHQLFRSAEKRAALLLKTFSVSYSRFSRLNKKLRRFFIK